MASLLDEELQLDPALQDWQIMPDGAPITEALQPRKPIDVSRGAPSSTQEQQPKQDMGGISALRQAMAQAQQNRLGAELGMAGETISRAFVPQQQSSGYWQRQLQTADRPVQELQAFEKQRGEAADRQLKQAEREGKSAYTQALQQQIQANIESKQRESDVATQRADKDSDLTRTWRSAFAQTPEGKTLAEAMGPDFERLTPALIEGSKGASDMLKSLRPAPTKAAPEVTPYQKQYLAQGERRLTLQEQKQDADKQAKEAKRVFDAEQHRIDSEAKKTAGNQAQQKDFEFIKGLEDTTRTLEANLNQLQDKVNTYGTQVFTGPQGTEMKSLIDDIATGYAKMKDPSTGVKEGEVAVEMRKFWDPESVKSAWSITNDTAKAVIQDLRDRVAKRAERSYEIRGFGQRNPTGPVVPPWLRNAQQAEGTGAAPAAPATGMTQPMQTPTGAVYMRFPDGTVRPVPPDKVQKALDAKAVEWRPGNG